MVRTNRTMSAQAPANMDDIDLDVMFAADGDALFDGLDIDLDMDDITGGSASVDSKRTGAPRPPLQSSFLSSPQSDVELLEGDESSRSRRKTKRKPKTPSFYEDDDDDYDDAPPTKKKRKTSAGKATTSTAPSKKKKASPPPPLEEVSPSKPPKGKAKSAKAALSVGMPPPLARTSTAGVAAAGQFGSRKRPGGSSFPALPKALAAAHPSGRVLPKLPLARATSEASSAASVKHKPRLQHNFCGLAPSSTHFYPFMPALPSEPALKSRKIFGTVDRIHTSLVSYLHTPPTASSGAALASEQDPIFQLMQEAFKEEKSSSSSGAAGGTVRAESIGIAIGELRRTISMFNKNQLVGDWYAVCALLRRQHDFLKQNCENMERWCRDNFSHEDFSFVFAPPNKQRKGTDEGASVFSVLRTFSRRDLKVKVTCTGLKDPKLAGFLPAVLPLSFLPSEVLLKDEKESKNAVGSKKKAEAGLAEGRMSENFFGAHKLKPPPQPLSYANMKPARRRRNVAEMISRTARELEKAHLARYDLLRRSLVVQKEEDLEKVVQESDSVCLGGIHTTGMWKWFELSGFLSDITETDIQDRLEDFRADLLLLESPPKPSTLGIKTQKEELPLFDQLQSLLVDVESGEGLGGEDDLDNSDFADVFEVFNVMETADMSQLTLEERSFVHLRKWGLVDDVRISTSAHITSEASESLPKRPIDTFEAPSSSTIRPLLPAVENGWSHHARARECEALDDDRVDDVISAMKADLKEVEELNGRRVAFLEKMSRTNCSAIQNRQQRSERETSLIAKCQQLLRKAKELKAKSGVTNRKDDSMALPW